MNNRARGRERRKCPSKGQESKYSQEEVVTNNEEFKQTDSQIRVVPSFIKKKKVAIPAHERIHEQTECKVNESNGQEEIEGCDAPDKSLLHSEHIEETETETEVSHAQQEAKPRAKEFNTAAAASPKEGQHPCCSHTPHTLQTETCNEPVGGTTDTKMLECSPQIAEVPADRGDLTTPPGETCGGVGVGADGCEHLSDEIPVPALPDEAEDVSLILSEDVLKSLKHISEECKSSETDDENVKSSSVEKVEDMHIHVEMEEADQDCTAQGYTSEVVISPVQVQDTNQTVTMVIDVNESEEDRKRRKCLSLNTDEVISDHPVQESGSVEDFNKTSDPSSVNKSRTKEKEMYDITSVHQVTDAKKNSAGILQCHSVVSREAGEVIAPEMTSGGGDESTSSTTSMKNTEASILAGSDVDAELDFTDSQLCEVVNMEESANQLLVLQEVRKQRMEGRKIIHDLILDLSHLNKLVLHTKREIETARRKRQPQSCVQNRVTGQSFIEHRKF
ncbi:uncharacterized protein LOC124271180 [Haliotis rubra]|uniref:uncharacterized protein LOC124271180 n=1 Tax=Haliotis rubra TaxID=36100 RepID=UPI001EE5F273|nr:uncharacterized protein LOC124271180 [Haliotis rubra]